MPHSNRGLLAALAGIAALLCAFGLGVFSVALSQPDQQPHTTQGTGKDPTIKLSPTGDAAGGAALPTSDWASCPRDESYYNCEDLKAQQNMSKWTRYMGLVAIVSVFFSIAGVWLIWRTWKATRDTAVAAHSANRPWLKIELDRSEIRRISETEWNASVLIKIKNLGPSPALKMALVSTSGIASVYEPVPINLKATNQPRRTIFQGEERPWQIGMPLTTDTLAKISNESVSRGCVPTIWFDVALFYMSEAGHHETTARFILVGAGDDIPWLANDIPPDSCVRNYITSALPQFERLT